MSSVKYYSVHMRTAAGKGALLILIFRRKIIFSLVPVRFLGEFIFLMSYKPLKPEFKSEFLCTYAGLFEIGK